MLPLTREPEVYNENTSAVRQRFIIEKTDVGRAKQNMRGFGHTTYTFTQSDVGRTISVFTDGTNWTCWLFDGRL